jgi:hypothetical protein
MLAGHIATVTDVDLQNLDSSGLQGKQILFGQFILKPLHEALLLKRNFINHIVRLYGMNERSTSPDRRSDMNSFRDVIEVHPLLKTALRVCVNAIGTLYRVRNGKADQDFFPFCQRPGGQSRAVPFHEFLKELRIVFAHFTEPVKIITIVIVTHKNVLLNLKVMNPSRCICFRALFYNKLFHKNVTKLTFFR